MPVFEWHGVLRVTTGELSRSEQMDLWTTYSQSEWFQDKDDSPERNVIRIMETDAMVAATATRKVEVCKDGKWVALKDGDTHTVITPDGDEFPITLPVTYEQINCLPRSLGDTWVRAGVAKNGGFNANVRFFTSLDLTSGRTSSEPTSAEPLSNTPKPATS